MQIGLDCCRLTAIRGSVMEVALAKDQQAECLPLNPIQEGAIGTTDSTSACEGS